MDKYNQKYEIETGFYQGSYYATYGVGLALFIFVVLHNYILGDEIIPRLLMMSFVLTLLILLPVIYALYKIIWANLFINYDKAFSF